MASPFHSRPPFVTPSPGLKASKSPISDETMWNRLCNAGFDEESIPKRNKASLIAYIAKLEAEIFEHQHQMGLIILENKDLSSKFDEMKSSYESIELKCQKEKAAQSNVLAEAKAREENLEKTLGVEKECIMNLEKALHEMRVEYAETKVAFENKWKEACKLMEEAEKKYSEAEAKAHSAEIKHEEANRCLRIADRKLQDIETREDDLRRRIISFKLDCDSKEQEMTAERQSLNERLRFTENKQRRLLEGQASLVDQEDHLFLRTQELDCLRKELADTKEMIENQSHLLAQDKSKLEQKIALISSQEKDIEEKEIQLRKREHELHTGQELQENKKSLKAEKLLADLETEMSLKRIKLEEDMKTRIKLMDEQMESRRWELELREVDLLQREEGVAEKENETAICLKSLEERESDVAGRMRDVEERERKAEAAETDAVSRRVILREEEESMKATKSELEKSMASLEEKRKQVECAEEGLLLLKNEREDLVLLELSLKEEVDRVREERAEAAAERDRLRVEKAAFETEWELLEEKRETLRREEAAAAAERTVAAATVLEERERMREERESMRERYGREAETLRSEREELVKEMERRWSELFSAAEEERGRISMEAEGRRREEENRWERKREEEGRRREEEERLFLEEKEREGRAAEGRREALRMEEETAAAERRRMEEERVEICKDRELREEEWEGLRGAIEELNEQRRKLEEQREVLRVDRSNVFSRIESIRRAEEVEEGVSASGVATCGVGVKRRRGGLYPAFRGSASGRSGWVKRCAELIFGGAGFCEEGAAGTRRKRVRGEEDVPRAVETGQQKGIMDALRQ